VNFLLDTNIVSEWTKPRPDAGVATWPRGGGRRSDLHQRHHRGRAASRDRLPVGARRERLDIWLTDQVPLRFEERLLTVDAEYDPRYPERLELRDVGR
jgi:hypothetical protein